MDYNKINLDEVLNAKNSPAPSEPLSWMLIHNDKAFLNNYSLKPNLLSITGSAVVVTDNKDIIATSEELMKSGKDVNILFLDMVMAGKGYRPLKHTMSNNEDIDTFIELLLSETCLDDYLKMRASFLLNALIRMMKDTVDENDITMSTLSNLIELSVTNYKKFGISALSELFDSDEVDKNDKSGFKSYFKSYMLTSEHHSDTEIYLSIQRALIPFLRMEDADNKGIKEQVSLDTISDKPSVLFIVYNKNKEHTLAEKLVISDILKSLNHKEVFNVPVTFFVDDDLFDPLAYKSLHHLVSKGVNFVWITAEISNDTRWKYDHLFNILDINRIHKKWEVKRILSEKAESTNIVSGKESDDSAESMDSSNGDVTSSMKGNNIKSKDAHKVPFGMKGTKTSTINDVSDESTNDEKRTAVNRHNNVKPRTTFKLKFDNKNSDSSTTENTDAANSVTSEANTTTISPDLDKSKIESSITEPADKPDVNKSDNKISNDFASGWLFQDDDN